MKPLETTHEERSVTAAEIRNMIRDSISAHGITQKQLAVMWGISQQFLSDVLKGRREPTGKILSVLGIRREVKYFVQVPF